MISERKTSQNERSASASTRRAGKGSTRFGRHREGKRLLPESEGLLRMNEGSRRRRHGSLGLLLALPPNLVHQMIDPTDHNSDAARGGAGCGRGGTGAGRRRRRGGMRPRATGRVCCCDWRAAVVLTVELVRDVSVGGIALVSKVPGNELRGKKHQTSIYAARSW